MAVNANNMDRDSMILLNGIKELEQIAFWKPMRVGDVIFNYWD